MIHLLALGTASPAAGIATSDLLAATKDRLSPELVGTIEGLGIRNRYSCIDNYASYLAGGRLRLHATTSELGMQAANACLERWSGNPRRIGLLIAATNTPARVLPALGSDIMSLMHGRLSAGASVVSMQGQGCSALLKAVELAQWYSTAHPAKTVMLVVSESNTSYLAPLTRPHYRSYRELARLYRDKRIDRLEFEESRFHTTLAIQAMLFGDGAAALLLGREAANPDASFGPIAHLTNDDPADSELLTMEWEPALADNPRPSYRMNSQVPHRGAHYALSVATQALSHPSSPARGVDELSACLIHTGSSKILDGVCDRLGLAPRSPQTRISYGTLENYGNLSAASIGFMLADNEGVSGNALVVAFGVGFTASAGIVSIA